MKALPFLLLFLAVSLSALGQPQRDLICSSEISICSATAHPAVVQATITDQSIDFFSALLDTKSWPARWHCGVWTPFHGWLYIASDTVIGLCYFMIPLILLFFLYKRKSSTNFRLIITLFILFILACGLTHFMDAAIFWWPAYRLSAVIRFLTASVSLGTVIALVKVAPGMLQLKSADELERIVDERTSELLELNKRLENEIEQRKKGEEQILKLYAELEHRVEQRTAQLETANKELEAFTYSVSHDLRAPLRIIDGFSQILLNDHADTLNEKGKRNLDIIVKNAMKMNNLIDDLLNLSKVGQVEMHKSSVDMASVVNEVLNDLRLSGTVIPNEMIIYDLKPIHGDFNLMKQVWVNLLSNAIKYSRFKEKPVIEVGMRVDNNSQTYYVKDNGAGFEMEYAHKLFQVFQRLHKPTDFEGTGVGLAIVKRIIDRHEGKVWAEAKVNEGATFYFSLPS